MNDPYDQRHGWRCPDGSFIKSKPTPPLRIRGELSGHEQAALDYMMSLKDTTLYDKLEEFASSEADRLNTEFLDWNDTDGHDVIKRFFESKGFKRVTADED